mmetsp:Transcript_61507/g.116244  ORF Transcript_61507/g.116244 Transcript_61507/m.116244 type:complete len:207 (-) Transcript_61507:367-987(-)
MHFEKIRCTAIMACINPTKSPNSRVYTVYLSRHIMVMGMHMAMHRPACCSSIKIVNSMIMESILQAFVHVLLVRHVPVHLLVQAILKVLLVPFDKLLNAILQWGCRSIVQITLCMGDIRISLMHITSWWHFHIIPDCLFVQRALKTIYQVRYSNWVFVSKIVDCIFCCLLGGRCYFVHSSHASTHNVIDVCEVTLKLSTLWSLENL